MQNIPPLSSKDIARVTGLAAKARSVVAFAGEEKPQRKSHTLRNVAIGIGAAGALGAGLYYGTRGRAKIKHTPALPLSGPVAAPKPERYTGGDDFDYGVPKGAKGYRMRPASSAWDPNKGLVHTPERREWYSARLGRLTVFSSRLDPVAADAAPVAGAEFAARLGRLIGFGRGDYAIAAMVRSGKLTAQEARTGYSRLPGRQSVMNTARGVAGAKLAAQRSHLAKTLIKDRTTLSALSTPVELTRGDYILPYLARSGKLEIRPMVGRAKLNMVNGYVSRTGEDIAAQAKNLANITAAAISRPKDYKRILNAELYAKPGHHTWIRGELARGFWNERAARAARTALSALSDRTVELAAPAPVVGDKIQRPQFVEDGGYVKIVRPDGTASEIGRAPGFANRLRRNKGKLIVGGLTTAAGAAFARELLRGRRLGKKA